MLLTPPTDMPTMDSTLNAHVIANTRLLNLYSGRSCNTGIHCYSDTTVSTSIERKVEGDLNHRLPYVKTQTLSQETYIGL